MPPFTLAVACPHCSNQLLPGITRGLVGCPDCGRALPLTTGAAATSSRDGRLWRVESDKWSLLLAVGLVLVGGGFIYLRETAPGRPPHSAEAVVVRTLGLMDREERMAMIGPFAADIRLKQKDARRDAIDFGVQLAVFQSWQEWFEQYLGPHPSGRAVERATPYFAEALSAYLSTARAPHTRADQSVLDKGRAWLLFRAETLNMPSPHLAAGGPSSRDFVETESSRARLGASPPSLTGLVRSQVLDDVERLFARSPTDPYLWRLHAEQILQAMQMERDLGHSPSIQTMLTYEVSHDLFVARGLSKSQLGREFASTDLNKVGASVHGTAGDGRIPVK